MNDLVIYESGNGGDLQLLGNDLATTDSFFNMPYLAWFGGNIEANTTGNEPENVERFDWWGNSLLIKNDKEKQFNSFIERILNNTALDSQGRQAIDNFAKKDLEFIQTFANVEVSTSILSDNKVQIDLKLTKPDNLEDKIYSYIWNASNNELITEITT